jgi:hypothetical protein
MVTTPAVIDTMKAFDEEIVPVVGEPTLNVGVPVIPVSEGTKHQQENKENVPQVEPVGTMEIPGSTGITEPPVQEATGSGENIQLTEEEEDDNMLEMEPPKTSMMIPMIKLRHRMKRKTRTIHLNHAVVLGLQEACRDLTEMPILPPR